MGFLRALLCCVGLCSLLLWALSWAQGPLAFGVLRALQTGAVAGIFPVIMGRAARAAGAGTLGILALPRWAGQSAGALTATSVYARWGSAAVFSVVHYLLVERPGAPKASATA